MPWSRFFARYLDLLLFALLLAALILLVGPEFLDEITQLNDAAFGILIMAAWIPFEAILLSSWGTTPGKAALGITLKTVNGDKLTFADAMRRSISVWARGVGCGLPIINLITAWWAYRKLQKTGTTSWDTVVHTEVFHAPTSTLRGVVVVLVLFGLMALIAYGNLK